MKISKVYLELIVISAVILGLQYGWNNFRVTSEYRKVDNFHGVYAGGLMNVYLKKGETESVFIRADDFLMDKVKTEVHNGILKIYTDEFIQGERIKEVYVTYVRLDTAIATDASTLNSLDLIVSDKFQLVASGAAEVKFRVNCKQLDLQMEQNANVQLAGQAEYFQFNIDHVGDLMAYNFFAKSCTSFIKTPPQSPGVARIQVSDTLSVQIEGPRHLYYKGAPKVVEKQISGGGKLVKY